ncbi:2A phosphatase associated protein of 46 kD [Perilla frutescens var. hirtella]|uniref:2A phosphatase associated protein of 46 kD n=1 Tax=Perilla frutescens var. hirtella TaxID=608512 RepID=A0AAD4P135_PERFH|nr:2A phosphatase associated protein of 46 kD [Perilla frutescens var. hirtella]
MVELNMEELSLPRLFEHSRKIHQAASDSSVDQDTVKKGCELLRKCEEMLGKLGLFSANETKEDISTTNLKYLLVPYYLGELTEKIAEEDRILVLKTSQAKLKEFISFCEAMELIPKEELDSSVHGTGNTFTDKRAKKAWVTTIALALCKAFDLLEMLKKEEEMLLSVRERQSQEGNDELSQSILDERSKKAEDWHRDAATRSRFTKPANPITCATFAQDVIEGRAAVSQAHEHKHQPMIFGPASLVGKNPTSERERMAAQVFQPSFRLPTMSIEEAGLKEMEIMNNWQERNVKLMEEANSSWHNDNPKFRPGEDDDDDDDDAAQDKARAWDDWKDDNPRGAGNTKLTPCG